MKFWNRWHFLILFLLCGVVVMTATDSWADAAKPAKDAGAWMKEVVLGKGENPGTGEQEGQVGTDPAGNSQLPGRETDGQGTSGSGQNASGEGLEGNGISGEGLEGNGISGEGSGGNVVPGEGSGTGEGADDGDSVNGNGGTQGLPDGGGPEGNLPGESGSFGGDTAEGGNGGSESLEGENPEEGGEAVPETLPAYRNPEDVVYTTVEDDYFADAVFIGDSRMVGMYEYGGFGDVGTFYVSKGLTIFRFSTAEIVEVPDEREKITIEQALMENQFGKVYLEVGINEMGTGDLERFLNAYQDVVNRIQELQPNAIIYIQAILKVTEARSNKGDYVTNQGIEDRNAGIAAMADNVKVYYLDVNPLVVDETGALNPDYTYDGVHLKGKHVAIWKDFLKEHAVVLD